MCVAHVSLLMLLTYTAHQSYVTLLFMSFLVSCMPPSDLNIALVVDAGHQHHLLFGQRVSPAHAALPVRAAPAAHAHA